METRQRGGGSKWQNVISVPHISSVFLVTFRNKCYAAIAWFNSCASVKKPFEKPLKSAFERGATGQLNLANGVMKSDPQIVQISLSCSEAKFHDFTIIQ